MKKEKIYKLMNKYQGDVVLCKDINDTVERDGYVFYKVFTENNPNRVYLVNKEAFSIIKS